MTLTTKRRSQLHARLAEFGAAQDIASKGPLSMVLVITRRASVCELPLDDDMFVTKKAGQVAGLGEGAVQQILTEHGIARVLAKEGGRTSRGNMGRMQAYIRFLNGLAADGLLDFDLIEEWWIERVRDYFAGQPLQLRADPALSLRRVIADLMEAARERQAECPGTMVEGAVMQHLVGAKLQICFPDAVISHRGFSVADEVGGVGADFAIGDAAIHVTTAPTDALLAKCRANLANGLRPVIITNKGGVYAAEAFASSAGIPDRVDMLDIEQFLATNVYEWSGFEQSARTTSLDELIATYNSIIEDCETDPSLKIAMA